MQLRDTTSTSVLPKVTAQSVPDAGVARNGQLLVSVVKRNPSDDQSDAGASAPEEPLVEARVHAFWQNGREYFDAGSATTDSSGKARLRALPQGVLWVLAEADGYARSSSQLIIEDEKRELSLSLEPAHTLDVTVTDEQSQPIKQATVLVTGHDPLPFGALTGQDAIARFQRLGKPPWTVKASAPGYESVTRSGISGTTSVVLRRLGALIVRVERAAGGPAVDAQIMVAGATLWPARSVRTDAHGAVLIRGLLAGSFDLRATLGNEVSRTELGVELKRGEEREVVLRLEPGRFANIHVTDGEAEDAASVPDAAVVVAESGLSSFPLQDRTDQDGRVRIGPIAPGPATASASAKDFVGGSTVAVPERQDAELRIPLVRGATLIGRVVDIHDHVIAGASVEIVGTDETGLPVAETPALRALRSAHFNWSLSHGSALVPAGELGVMPGPVPPIPGAVTGLANWGYDGAGTLAGTGLARNSVLAGAMVSPDIDPWVSRSDGTFRAHPVTPGRLRAIVRHPEYVEGISDVVTLSPGGVAEVKVVLHEGGRLEGRVVDDRDFPVGGARVDLAAVKGTTVRTTLTADDGSFAFAAVPLEVTLTVERPAADSQRTAVRRSLTLREDKRETVVIVLPAERESVQFKVTDEPGNALENAEVQVTSLAADIPLKRTNFTDADGQLSVADARGLALRVRCDLPGFVPTTQTFDAAPATIHVVLKRGVVVAGRVTSVRGRRNVEGAIVTIVSEGQRRVALTNGEGQFTIRDVAPGAIHLHVAHDEFAPADRNTVVKTTGRTDRPFELEDIDLSEPGSVSGIVLDRNGNPVAGSRVATYPVPAYLAAMPRCDIHSGGGLPQILTS